MSTFNGIVTEFPEIRIDFFRKPASSNPPLACFLSHTHSDHLQGLESHKSPFIYCSAVTRNLLLRIEKYPHRMNYIKGVLECRKQHYKHLKRLLKAIPLNCPTEIELRPMHSIRVTLFEANHCPGAVMFLIEGQGKTILYTGDVRSESWWIGSLVRDPVLLPYSTGLKVIDRIYLDTTFAVKEDIYRRFPLKAQGLSELLHQVTKFPSDTIFYLSAWTLGYEDVWVALSALLHSKIHVDSYQLGLYASGRRMTKHSSYTLAAADAPVGDGSNILAALTGYTVGNHEYVGCLTDNPNVRIHSCKPGTPCHASLSRFEHVVWLTPIICRSRTGAIVPELGAGGGGGDSFQQPELDVGNVSLTDIENLVKHHVRGDDDQAQVLLKLSKAWKSREQMMDLDGLNLDDETPPSRVFQLLSSERKHPSSQPQQRRDMQLVSRPNSKDIGFPYARHSSYEELRALVSAFKPRDIYPCTVDEKGWSEEVSMRALFGDLCSNTVFEHDQEMLLRQEIEGGGSKPVPEQPEEETQNNFASTASSSVAEDDLQPSKDWAQREVRAGSKPTEVSASIPSTLDQGDQPQFDVETTKPRKENDFHTKTSRSSDIDSDTSSGTNRPSKQRLTAKEAGRISEAYRAALLTLETNDTSAWQDLGIISIGKSHTESELEL